MLDGSFLHRSASNSDPPSLETQINCISGNCQKTHIFPTGYYGINTGSLRDKYGLWKTWFFRWIQNTGLIRDKYGINTGSWYPQYFQTVFFTKIMNSYHICPRMNGSGSKKVQIWPEWFVMDHVGKLHGFWHVLPPMGRNQKMFAPP